LVFKIAEPLLFFFFDYYLLGVEVVVVELAKGFLLSLEGIVPLDKILSVLQIVMILDDKIVIFG
jgi:hypothetical protein